MEQSKIIISDFNPVALNYVHITSTTHGTWLPGDKRGFVSALPDGQIHNVPGTPYNKDMSGLYNSAKNKMKSLPVYLTEKHAQMMLPALLSLAKLQHWTLFAAAVMCNHFHIAAMTPKEFDKPKILQYVKAHLSIPLNKEFGKQTWWTSGGSVRFANEKEHFRNVIFYVLNQENPLLVFNSFETAGAEAPARKIGS